MTFDQKAYAVSYSGVSGIVFAENEYGALTEGARLMRIGIEDIHSCSRLFWADQYAGRDIPTLVLYENEWITGPWSQCVTCKTQVYKGSHDELGHPHDPVFEPSRLFCSAACHVDCLIESFTTQERQRLREEAVTKRYPGISRVSATGYPEDPVVTFRFRGATGDAQWNTSTGQLFVQNQDMAAWFEYRKSIANGVLA